MLLSPSHPDSSETRRESEQAMTLTTSYLQVEPALFPDSIDSKHREIGR